MNEELPPSEGAIIPPDADGSRKLVAIFFSDIKDYSRTLQANERTGLAMLEEHNRIMRSLIGSHHGTVLKTIGDAFLASFESVLNAVQCAIRIQQEFIAFNSDRSNAVRINVRIGIHLGDVLIRDGDVFGDHVNIASRVQSLAEPGGINITGSVYEQVKNKLDLRVISLGIPQLKNISEHVRVYQVVVVPRGVGQSSLQARERYLLTLLSRKKIRNKLAAAAALLAVALYVWLRWFSLPPQNSIAVLPFSFPAGVVDEYIADGLTTTLIERLSYLPGMKVISEGSSFYYKSRHESEKEVAEKLGVRNLLGGDFGVSGNDFRIRAYLSNPGEGTILWKEEYVIPRDQFRDMVDVIAHKIAQHLKLEFSPERERHDPEAYLLFLHGLYESRKHQKEGNAAAIDYFSRAAARDSTFARNYFELATAQVANCENRWDVNEQWYTAGELNCKQALRLDPSLGEGYGLLGRLASYRGNHAEALQFLQKGIKLNPNDIVAYQFLGYEYSTVFNENLKANECFVRAYELEPTNVGNVINLGSAAVNSQDYAKAIQWFRRALFLVPADAQTWKNLGVTYEKIGMLDSATAALFRAQELDASSTEATEDLGELFLAESQYARAESLLALQCSLHPKNYRLQYQMGIAFSARSAPEPAKEWWERSYHYAQDEAAKNPTLADPLLFCALSRARLDKKEEALSFVNRLTALDTLSADNMIGAARVQAILQDKDAVLTWFAKARLHDPSYDESYLKTALDFERFRDDPELLAVARH